MKIRILLLFALALSAFAQTATIAPVAKQQFLDATGAPLANGRVCFFNAGTTTPATTYQDSGQVTPNADPIVLDSGGYAPPIYFATQKYKISVYGSLGADSNCPNAGTLLWSVDNLNGPAGPVVLSPTGDQTITAHNLLPNAANTTQSLGSSSAPWLGWFYSETVRSLNNVIHIGADINYGGISDIGGQANAAYAALPSTGGTIVVDPKSDGTAFDFSTPLVFGVNNKPVSLVCSLGVTLHYTPTTATNAITLNYGNGGAASAITFQGGPGIHGCTLRGQTSTPFSTSANGVVDGGNGFGSSVIEQSTIEGFNDGIQIGSSNSFMNVIKDNVINFHKDASIFVGNGANNTENNRIIHNFLSNANYGVKFDTTVGGGDWTIDGNAFDGEGVAALLIADTAFDAQDLQVRFCANHVEDIGGAAVTDLIQANGGQVNICNNEFVIDKATGGPYSELILIANGAAANIDNNQAHVASTYNYLASITSSAIANFRGNLRSGLTNLVNTTGAGNVCWLDAAQWNCTKGRFKLSDQGNCTMAAGTCAAQNLASTYASAPLCTATWDGTGALAGSIKIASTTTTVTPSSSNGADTAHVNWMCFGN